MPEKKALSKWTRTRRCKHVHVSGRRCPARVKLDVLLCGNHKHGICSECHSMLEAFTPPRGWPKGTGDF